MEDKLLKENLEGEENSVEGVNSEGITPEGNGSEGINPEDVPPAAPTDAPVTSADGEVPLAPESTPIVEEDGAVETSIKTFTQDDVDKLVGDTRVKTREKTFNYIYNRYGVKNEEEMDALVANAQRYDTLKEQSDADRSAWETEKSERDGRLTEMSEEIALMKSGVDAERYEDVKLILKGKGLEVNMDNIQSELATHPEWISKKEEEEVPNPETEKAETPKDAIPTVTTRIKALGNEPKPASVVSEEEQAEKLFKMKFH